MKILLDDTELEDDFTGLNKKEILQKIQGKLEDSIIDKVYLDEVETNLDYFMSNDMDVSEFDRIHFISKDTDSLIEETLEEASNYLPKLKDGVKDIAQLLEEKKTARAGNKFLLSLEGFEWYTGVLDNIQSLISDDELENNINEVLEDFNVIMDEALSNQKEGNQERLADIMSGEIKNMVERFINLNELLLKKC